MSDWIDAIAILTVIAAIAAGAGFAVVWLVRKAL